MPFLGAHIPELIAVVVLAVLFFGPKRLPELGSSVGKTITEFRKGMRETGASDKDNAPAALAAPAQGSARDEPPTGDA